MSLFPALLSVSAVSLVSLIGVLAISVREDLIKKYIFLFVSLAVGALLGDAFIHLIPEGLAEIQNPTTFSILIILGILLFFIIEKYLHWHHHGEAEDLTRRARAAGAVDPRLQLRIAHGRNEGARVRRHAAAAATR